MIGIHWGDVILLGWALVLVALLVFGLRVVIRRLRNPR